MKRSWICGMAGIGLLLSAAVSDAGGAGSAGVVFVAPVRPSVLQVLQDVVGRFPGALLISYQAGATPEDILLHRWDGRQWDLVSNEAYRDGRLTQGRPRRLVLFGPDEILPEQLVLDSEAWAGVVLAVPDMDSASVLNTAGRLLGFSPADWRLYARRYALRLADENEPQREDTWFDQPHEPRHFQWPDLPTPPRRRDRRGPDREAPSVRRPAPPPTPMPSPSPDLRRERAAPSEAPEEVSAGWRRPMRAPSGRPPPNESVGAKEIVLPEPAPSAEPSPAEPEKELRLPRPIRAAPARPEGAEAGRDEAAPGTGIK